MPILVVSRRVTPVLAAASRAAMQPAAASPLVMLVWPAVSRLVTLEAPAAAIARAVRSTIFSAG
ncbi:MAG: hypothetical protein ISQ70_07715 [Pirellulales bacterium]|nr:hypothetical protein [Pirellulales bacterium]